MRLTTKGRFAVTAILDVALRQSQGPVALSAIGQRHKISVSYLEQLFAQLRRAGLVRAVRGPGGGYMLERNANQISVADIVLSVDANPDEAEDFSGLTQDLWNRLGERMGQMMSGISLQQLVDEQIAKGVVIEPAPKATMTKTGISPRPALKPIKTTAPNSVFAWAGLLNR